MELHVSLSSDENYLPFLGTAVLSLLENNKEFTNITFHLLLNSISSENEEKLKTLIDSYNRECIIYDMSNIRELLGNLKVDPEDLSKFLRLFLIDILPQDVNKIIYLDCDSLITNSFYKLWELNIDDYLSVGVEDVMALKFKKFLKIHDDNKYINTGMMLMNIKKLRDENWSKKIKKYINNFKGKVPHHDQGVINALFQGKMLIIHPKYNCITPFYLMKSKELIQLYNLGSYYSDRELLEATNDPVFVHLTPSFIKRPWVKGSRHPMVEKYLFYLNKTPWSDFKLEEDKRALKIKFIAFLFRVLPFRVFYIILKIIKVI